MERDILGLNDLDLNLDESENVQPVKTPGRKIRKLTPRNQGLVDEHFELLSSP